MGTEQGHPGVCTHCGAEVAEDGFAVRMAEEGESPEVEAPREKPSLTPEAAFAEAIRNRRAPDEPESQEAP